MQLEKTNFISVADAAEIIGVTMGRVRQLLQCGQIKGQHLTPRAWAVDRRSAEKYARTERQPGPKPAV